MKIKWILLKITLLLVAMVLLLTFTQKQYKLREVSKVVKSIDYSQGNHFINDGVIDHILKNSHKDYPKMAMQKVDTQEMEYLLNKNEFIANANVYLDNDGVLNTQIEQEQPVTRIHYGSQEYYITKYGKKINLSPVFSSEVMITEGKIEPKEYLGLVQLTKLINEDNLLKNLVTGIRKEKVNSFILFMDDGTYDVELGDLNNLEEKLENFKVFHQKFIDKSVEMPYKKLNLRFKNQIVASK